MLHLLTDAIHSTAGQLKSSKKKKKKEEKQLKKSSSTGKLVSTDKDSEPVLDTSDKQKDITETQVSAPIHSNGTKPQQNQTSHHHRSHGRHSKSKSLDYNSSRGDQTTDSQILNFFTTDWSRKSQEKLQNSTTPDQQQIGAMSSGEGAPGFTKESGISQEAYGSQERSQKKSHERELMSNEDTWSMCGVKLSQLCNELLRDESEVSKVGRLTASADEQAAPGEGTPVSVGKLIQFF